MNAWLEDDAWVQRHLEELSDQADRDRRATTERHYLTQRQIEGLQSDVIRLSRLLQVTWVVLVVAWAFF